MAVARTVVLCLAVSVPLVRAFAMEPTVFSAAVDLEPHVVQESFVPAIAPSEKAQMLPVAQVPTANVEAGATSSVMPRFGHFAVK